ncbi:MAG: phosphoribosyltransferase family protein [Nanoarchaeota archaeon]
MFHDRLEAGKILAQELSAYLRTNRALVLAIPRGGIVVAAEVAKALHLPLDVLVIKKLGFPGNEELAVGAVGLNEKYLNQELLNSPEVTKEFLATEIKRKQREVKERYARLRGKRKMYSVRDKIVIVVDDGIATGATMFLALQILRKQKPRKLIVAVPVAPPETVSRLQQIADEVVALEQPLYLGAIGQWYERFEPVEEREAKQLLHL